MEIVGGQLLGVSGLLQVIDVGIEWLVGRVRWLQAVKSKQLLKTVDQHLLGDAR